MAPKFNLQNVLDIRHSKVEAIEIELGKLLMMQTEAESRLVSLLSLKDELLNRLSAALQGELDILTIQLLNANSLEVDKLIEKARADLQTIVQKVEAKRKVLVLAKQDEEVLEILKQKRIDVFNAEQVRVEGRAQDDIYIARAFQNQTQGM
jgi:flagellar export protein FliJ